MKRWIGWMLLAGCSSGGPSLLLTISLPSAESRIADLRVSVYSPSRALPGLFQVKSSAPAPGSSGTFVVRSLPSALALRVVLHDSANTVRAAALATSASHRLTLTLSSHLADSDDDGVPEDDGHAGRKIDNCPSVQNEDQADSDGDGIGDVCPQSDLGIEDMSPEPDLTPPPDLSTDDLRWPGAECTQASECFSLVCTAGKCQSATCADGVKNQGESDIDCGNEVCPFCANGKSCSQHRNCQTGTCIAGVCSGCGGVNQPCCYGTNCARTQLGSFQMECNSGVCNLVDLPRVLKGSTGCKSPNQLCIAAGFNGATDAWAYFEGDCAGPGACPAGWTGLTCSDWCSGVTCASQSYCNPQKVYVSHPFPNDQLCPCLVGNCIGNNPGYTVRAQCY